MHSFNQDLHELVEIKVREASLISIPDRHPLADKVFNRKVNHFNDKYCQEMERIIFEIYDELCPDDEVKPIGDYVANHYTKYSGIYDVPHNEGVIVHLDDFSFTTGRLVLLPDPARIVLQNPDTKHREVLWSAA